MGAILEKNKKNDGDDRNSPVYFLTCPLERLIDNFFLSNDAVKNWVCAGKKIIIIIVFRVYYFFNIIVLCARTDLVSRATPLTIYNL